MRRVSSAVALTLSATLAVVGLSSGAARADEQSPSSQDVQQAQAAAVAKAEDVAGVQAQLALANQKLQASAVAAAQAAEAFNGARWQAQQARAAARDAEGASRAATADVDRQRRAYSDALVTSYQLAPGMTTLSAMAQSDGIEGVIEQAASLDLAESALDAHYDQFRAAATVADVATQQAQDARAAAEQAADQARAARDAARRAEQAAADEAAAIATEKTQLIAQLAELQHISADLAARRQAALEAKAAAAAAAAAQAEQEKQAQAAQAAQPSSQQGSQPSGSSDAATSGDSGTSPSPAPAPAPAPNPPAPSGGAQAAIDFARAQLGEPYRWGAAGPDAWDCSGLTMGAWAAGGVSLPHYSVAQYGQSTPITASQLRPGDLVFWGSTNSPSSIYHVALYIGGGQIIHAPRTGENVTVASMYYWIPPTFFARP